MAQIAFVNPGLCDKRPACPSRYFCPQKAIYQKNNKGSINPFLGGLSIVDPAKCTGCGICVRYCPHKAISIINA